MAKIEIEIGGTKSSETEMWTGMTRGDREKIQRRGRRDN
jgi:hypothetical protein